MGTNNYFLCGTFYVHKLTFFLERGGVASHACFNDNAA